MLQYTGCSGFNYREWKSFFYPPKLPAKNMLSYYAGQFNTVEINNTFYKFPVAQRLERMYAETPDDFVFSVKVHKIVTHSKRMKDARQKTEEFAAIVRNALQHKLKCLLFQLPPTFVYTEENLERVLRSVPGEPHHVVEFRHISWWNETVASAFKQYKITFCNVSFPGLQSYIISTTPVFYFRFHGIPQLFKSPYSDKELKSAYKTFPADSIEQFIYFNNTMEDAAINNARFIRQLKVS